jgi:hypothetical protein
MAKDVLRHKHGDHMLEGFTNDGKGVVVGILMGMDLSACGIISHYIVFGSVGSVGQCADSHLESAFSNSAQALSVEHIHWSGVDNTQSGNCTIDIIFFPSKDRVHILSSLEVAHLELVLR